MSRAIPDFVRWSLADDGLSPEVIDESPFFPVAVARSRG
jgi:hypothetical protein